MFDWRALRDSPGNSFRTVAVRALVRSWERWSMMPSIFTFAMLVYGVNLSDTLGPRFLAIRAKAEAMSYPITMPVLVCTTSSV
jgi:hypothetical protein